MKNILKIGIIVIVVSGIILLVIIYFISSIFKGNWEDFGDVLFVNLKDTNSLIVSQEYETGAWDSETPVRIAKLNLKNEKVELVDTSKINKDQWIHLIPKRFIWRGTSVGSCLGADYFKEFMDESEDNGRLVFQHNDLNDFSRIINPVSSNSQLMPNWVTYSDNSFSDKFKVYVFCKYSTLILYTIGNDNSRLGQIALYHESKGADYVYNKHTTFSEPNRFKVIIDYQTFDIDNHSNPIQNSIKAIRVINEYEIKETGEIHKINKEKFGNILIKKAL